MSNFFKKLGKSLEKIDYFAEITQNVFDFSHKRYYNIFERQS